MTACCLRDDPHTNQEMRVAKLQGHCTLGGFNQEWRGTRFVPGIPQILHISGGLAQIKGDI